MLIDITESFDDGDAEIVKGLIHEIFAASRMGNSEYANKKLNLLGTLYGKPLQRRVRRTLRYDKKYLKGEVY